MWAASRFLLVLSWLILFQNEALRAAPVATIPHGHQTCTEVLSASLPFDPRTDEATHALRGAEFVFNNEVYYAPSVMYRRPPEFSLLAPETKLSKEIQVGADLLSRLLGTKIRPAFVERLGHLVGSGSYRLVFQDPRRPGWLVKIYRGARHDSLKIAQLIQREITLYDMLREANFRVADLEWESKFLESGIVFSKHVSGYRFKDRLRDFSEETRAREFGLRMAIARLERFDRDFIIDHATLWNMTFSGVDSSGKPIPNDPHALDVFPNFRNMKFDYQTHEPVMFDY